MKQKIDLLVAGLINKSSTIEFWNCDMLHIQILRDPSSVLEPE